MSRTGHLILSGVLTDNRLFSRRRSSVELEVFQKEAAAASLGEMGIPLYGTAFCRNRQDWLW